MGPTFWELPRYYTVLRFNVGNHRFHGKNIDKINWVDTLHHAHTTATQLSEFYRPLMSALILQRPT